MSVDPGISVGARLSMDPVGGGGAAGGKPTVICGVNALKDVQLANCSLTTATPKIFESMICRSSIKPAQGNNPFAKLLADMGITLENFRQGVTQCAAGASSIHQGTGTVHVDHGLGDFNRMSYIERT